KTPSIASVGIVSRGGKQRATPVVVAGSGSSGNVLAAVEEGGGKRKRLGGDDAGVSVPKKSTAAGDAGKSLTDNLLDF
ncbi:hypothetical protein HDU99_005844, partial [Rhizoclosmatium hyalinum]